MALQSKFYHSKQLNRLIVHGLSHLILAIIGASTLLPLVWMILTSLKLESELWAYPPTWLPEHFAWQSYLRVFQVMPFARMAFNSVELVILNVLGVLLSCSLAGFSFARLQYPGRERIFGVLLATMMIPGAVTLVPIYIAFARLHLVDTHYPLFVPAFFGNAWGIFFLRQYFMTLPQELLDEAEIDGCDPFGTYWRIVLPLSTPVIATLGLFTFMGNWNNLLGPLIYLNTLEKMTLPIGLCYFRGAQMGTTDWAGMMAGSVIMVLPVLILFIFTQRYFVRGIVLTGMKM